MPHIYIYVWNICAFVLWPKKNRESLSKCQRKLSSRLTSAPNIIITIKIKLLRCSCQRTGSKNKTTHPTAKKKGGATIYFHQIHFRLHLRFLVAGAQSFQNSLYLTLLNFSVFILSRHEFTIKGKTNRRCWVGIQMCICTSYSRGQNKRAFPEKWTSN